MDNYVQKLGLDGTAAENIAIVYQGYAKLLREQQTEASLELQASSWMISALFTAIKSPREARELFFEAAIAYEKLKSPFRVVCEICTQQRVTGVEIDPEKNDLFEDPDTAIFAILQFLDIENYNVPGLSEYLSKRYHEVYLSRIPGINIPYRVILEFLSSSYNWEPANNFGSSEVVNVLNRLGEQQRLLMRDRTAWENLEGQIVPIDPLSLSLTIIILKRWLRVRPYSMLKTLLGDSDAALSVMVDIAHELIVAKKLK